MDLEEIAVALDAFPHWDEQMRADVFHAIDTAPDTPRSSWGEAKEYFEGAGHRAWKRVRVFALEVSDGRPPVNLEEAAGYESAPTKAEILKALHRGAGMVRK